MKKPAVYFRVSGRKQRDNAQYNETKQYLSNKGIDIDECLVFRDQETGGKMTRQGLNQLQKDVAKGKISHIYIYKLDRLSRSGTLSVLEFNEFANSKGVKIEYVVDQMLNTENESFRNIMTSILAEKAREERADIRRRVRDGVHNAMQNGTRTGKPVGRPKKADRYRDEVLRMKSEGYAPKEIYNKLPISRRTYYHIVNEPEEAHETRG